MELKDKKVVVVGLGRSGIAAARLLAQQRAEVWVTDQRSGQELAIEMEALKNHPIHFMFGGDSSSAFSGASLVVVSPGVPTALLDGCGVPVIGETELAFRYLTAPLVAITGTNGKSTTTALAGEILRTWGKRVFVGGNLGTPLCEAACSPDPWDWVVAEVSSFQLETIETFHPRIAVLLNVTPNHLERYARFSDYLSAKLRIFFNQTASDQAVVNLDDPVSGTYRTTLKADVVAISRTVRPTKGVWVEGDRLISDLGGLREIARRSEILLRGEYNLENVLAAVAVARLAGCPAEIIRKALGQFPGLEHRLEIVKRSRGVLYVNDSKATTVAATACALKGFEEPVVLIAGGQDKGMDFGPLRPIIHQKARAVVLIGEARERIRQALKGTVPVYEATKLKEAVETATTLASPGDVVLMAPGCASFDMFRDFEDRGRQFKSLVVALS